MDDEILAVVEASPARRVIGIWTQVGLGLALIYVAFSQPAEPGWQVALLAMGAGALWMADRMRRATESRLELTRTEIRSSEGITLARLDEIVDVERGAFSFKPSSGFVIITQAPGQRAWRPGLWWRLGRRVGIGGVTPAAQTKAMSEILAALIISARQDTP